MVKRGTRGKTCGLVDYTFFFPAWDVFRKLHIFGTQNPEMKPISLQRLEVCFNIKKLNLKNTTSIKLRVQLSMHIFYN